MNLFEAHKVTKMFGGLTAVHTVDFTLEKGMIAGLIGPNGAGKTTFFNTMTGIYQITSGEMKFDGQDITKLKPFQITASGRCPHVPKHPPLCQHECHRKCTRWRTRTA